MKKYILLSYQLTRETPCYGSNPSLKIEPQRSLGKGDTCNTHMVQFHNHTGTHVDCPNHFIKDGKAVTDYSISDLIFDAPAVIDCPKKEDELVTPEDFRGSDSILRGKNLLLIRTGFYSLRNKDVYTQHNPGIHPEAIAYLRENFPELKCLGIDSLSVSSFQNRELGHLAHKSAFQKSHFQGDPLLVIEDMNLSPCLSHLRKVFVAPLFIGGIDASPCTIIGELETK